MKTPTAPSRNRRPSSERAHAHSAAGFTLMELLIAMAIFAVIGTAVVTLLGQGMGVFTQGTSDTSMHDRLDALLPTIREDLAAIYVPEATGAPPPPRPLDPLNAPKTTDVKPEAPSVRLRACPILMTDQAKETANPVSYVAWVRTDARESEDPMKREAGSVVRQGAELKTYDPSSQEAGVKGNTLLPTGGLMEIAYVAVAEDTTHPGVMTLYRAFRAPVGGEKTLLEPGNLDTLAKVKAAGRVVAQGVLDFRVTFRNVFATAWDESLAKGHVDDGRPYAGPVWDSTRARDKQFALYKGPDSLGDFSDDVFPARARIELTLAYPAPVRSEDVVQSLRGTEMDVTVKSDWARAETRIADPVTEDATKISLLDVGPLVGPGPSDRWLKVNGEWMSTSIERVNLDERTVVVGRGRRGTPPRAHPSLDPIYVGVSATTDVPLVSKDHYVRRR